MACLLPCFLLPLTKTVYFANSSDAASNYTSLLGDGLETTELKLSNVYCFSKSSISLFHSYYHVLIWLGCIWKEAAVMMLYLFGPYILTPHLCSNCSIHTVNFPIFPLGKLLGISEEQHDARLYRLEHFQFVRFNWQY